MLSAWLPCQKGVSIRYHRQCSRSINHLPDREDVHTLRREELPSSHISAVIETCNSPHVQRAGLAVKVPAALHRLFPPSHFSEALKHTRTCLEFSKHVHFFCWTERMCSPHLLKTSPINQQQEFHVEMTTRARQLTRHREWETAL